MNIHVNMPCIVSLSLSRSLARWVEVGASHGPAGLTNDDVKRPFQVLPCRKEKVETKHTFVFQTTKAEDHTK